MTSEKDVGANCHGTVPSKSLPHKRKREMVSELNEFDNYYLTTKRQRRIPVRFTDQGNPTLIKKKTEQPARGKPKLIKKKTKQKSQLVTKYVEKNNCFLQCKACKINFTTKSLYLSHKAEHAVKKSEEVRKKMTQSGLKMAKKNRQQSVSVRPKPEKKIKPLFYCKYCSSSFKLERTLRSHEVQHVLKAQLCGGCGVRFPSINALQEHHNRRNEDGRIIVCGTNKKFCQVCKIMSVSRYATARHILNHHVKSNGEKVSLTPDEQAYVGEMLLRKFCTMGALLDPEPFEITRGEDGRIILPLDREIYFEHSNVSCTLSHRYNLEWQKPFCPICNFEFGLALNTHQHMVNFHTIDNPVQPGVKESLSPEEKTMVGKALLKYYHKKPAERYHQHTKPIPLSRDPKGQIILPLYKASVPPGSFMGQNKKNTNLISPRDLHFWKAQDETCRLWDNMSDSLIKSKRNVDGNVITLTPFLSPLKVVGNSDENVKKLPVNKNGDSTIEFIHENGGRPVRVQTPSLAAPNANKEPYIKAIPTKKIGGGKMYIQVLKSKSYMRKPASNSLDTIKQEHSQENTTTHEDANIAKVQMIDNPERPCVKIENCQEVTSTSSPDTGTWNLNCYQENTTSPREDANMAIVQMKDNPEQPCIKDENCQEETKSSSPDTVTGSFNGDQENTTSPHGDYPASFASLPNITKVEKIDNIKQPCIKDENCHEVTIPSPPDTITKSFNCYLCSSVFRSQGGLISHIQYQHTQTQRQQATYQFFEEMTVNENSEPEG